MKNLKFLSALVLSIVMFSCSEDIETLDVNTSNETFQNFLEENNLTDSSVIVQDGKQFKISDLQNDSEMNDLMSRYNDAYSVHHDGSFVFLYSELQSAQPDFENIDDFQFNGMTNTIDKVDNPVWFTFTVYKDTRYRGRNLKFSLRKNAVKGKLFDSGQVFRLNRIFDGRYKRNISSLKLIRTRAGDKADYGIEVEAIDSFSINDEPLGFISNFATFNSAGTDDDNVLIPNLGKLNFSVDGEIDPRGLIIGSDPLPRNNRKTSWDDKIIILIITSDMN